MNTPGTVCAAECFRGVMRRQRSRKVCVADYAVASLRARFSGRAVPKTAPHMNDIIKLPAGENSPRLAATIPRNDASPEETGNGRRRIAMISTHGYVAANPPLGAADTGGQVVYVLELSKHLAQLGFAVDIWTRRFEEQPEIEHVAEHVRIVRMPCGGSSFIPKEYLHRSLGEWSRNALRFITEHALEYEFINSHYWDAGMAGRILATELGVPHIHTPHSLGIWKKRQMETDFPQDRDRFEELYNFTERNREEERLYRDADLLVATTPVQTDLLLEDYGVPLRKMRMVTPGYDDSRFFPVGAASREALRRKFGFRGKTILSLGRLARNKGYDLLIRGFEETLKRVPDARLHLAVGGEAMSRREQTVLAECRELVANLGLEERVDFSGYVADEHLADMYRAADVFALASRYEPFGMTAIEAMACGTPVVATTSGGLWRVMRFGVDGLFADPFDALDLGITLSKPLIHPELHARLSRLGAERARMSFTWTGIAQELAAAVGRKSTEPPTLVPALEPDFDWPLSAIN